MELKEFKLQVLPLRDKLYGFANKILDNPDDAEDAVQDVMMKLWNMRNSLDECRSIEAFSMTMVRNVAIDKQRSPGNDMASLDGLLVLGHSPEQLYEVKEEAQLVRQIIDRLPELQRNTIRMKDIEGYENEEIAEITGCSAEAVRSNLSRARKQVRNIYLQLVKERERLC